VESGACVTVASWYCAGTMKNITVRVSEEVYRNARVRAAQQGNSVSGLVSEFLRRLADSDAEFVRLEERQREVQRRIVTFRAGDRLDRDEVHDRAVR
jgi:plasmid stability protein